MTADPWVRRCPKGHANTKHRHTLGKTVCDTCGIEWRGGPIDVREVDGFPVEDRTIIKT